MLYPSNQTCIDDGTHRAGGFGFFAALKNIESLRNKWKQNASARSIALTKILTHQAGRDHDESRNRDAF